MFWWLFADVNEDRQGVNDSRFKYISDYVSILIMVFMILAVIVALNMLISMMSYSFENVMVSYFSGSKWQSGKKALLLFWDRCSYRLGITWFSGGTKGGAVVIDKVSRGDQRKKIHFQLAFNEQCVCVRVCVYVCVWGGGGGVLKKEYCRAWWEDQVNFIVT